MKHLKIIARVVVCTIRDCDSENRVFHQISQINSLQIALNQFLKRVCRIFPPRQRRQRRVPCRNSAKKDSLVTQRILAAAPLLRPRSIQLYRRKRESLCLPPVASYTIKKSIGQCKPATFRGRQPIKECLRRRLFPCLVQKRSEIIRL